MRNTLRATFAQLLESNMTFATQDVNMFGKREWNMLQQLLTPPEIERPQEGVGDDDSDDDSDDDNVPIRIACRHYMRRPLGPSNREVAPRAAATKAAAALALTAAKEATADDDAATEATADGVSTAKRSTTTRIEEVAEAARPY